VALLVEAHPVEILLIGAPLVEEHLEEGHLVDENQKGFFYS
tara:strand:- start:449 stop:571 length:123 start_codon:yes stop_codon:yes gene_type:complete